MKRLIVLAISSVLVAIYGTPATAQIPATPRELGMGGAYMGMARGFRSVFLAPGNIAVNGAPRWSVAFPQVALGGALYGPEITDLLDLAEFDEQEQSRQDELLALIPDDGTRAQYALHAPLVALTTGGLGLGVRFVSVGSHILSRDLTELFLEGYEEGRTDYEVGNTSGERAAYWDFAASYGRNFGGLSIGVTGHYLLGRTLVQTGLTDPRIDVNAQEIEVDYIGVLVRGGSGYGLDVGAAFNPSNRITLSGAVSNVISEMTWSDDLKLRQLLLDRPLIDNATPKDLMNRYEASETDLDLATASPEVVATAAGLFDETALPAVTRVGLAWNPFGSTHIAADFHKKLTDSRFGDEWDQRLAIGVQQGLSIFNVRAGYAVGNDGGNLLGGGLSIGPFDLGVAKYQRSDIAGDRTRGWIGTFGLAVDQPEFD